MVKKEVLKDAVDCSKCRAWCTSCAFTDSKCVAWNKLKELLEVITGEKKIEDKFTCSECCAVTKESDYLPTDANLYYALKQAKLCEVCARAGKSFFGRCEK